MYLSYNYFMFNLNQFPEIINHLKNISSLYKTTNSGWVQLFCPYCGDSLRKNNTHGHLYICNSFPYFICFRCGQEGNIVKLLNDTNFKDKSLLAKLVNINAIFNYKNVEEKLDNDFESFKNKLIKSHALFFADNHKKYMEFLKYINFRSPDIDPIKYLLSPNIINNQLVCEFYNYNSKLSNTRIIGNSKQRFLLSAEFYYFQDIHKCLEYDSIVICEGAIDLINLSRFYPRFKNSFFISCGGQTYFNKVIKHLISRYLLTGNYIVNIVLDNDTKNFNLIKKFCSNVINKLNSEIRFKYWISDKAKDVSELMSLSEVT